MPPLEAPIAAVTVYTDRARVTRRGTVHLAPGEHTLTVAGLPPTLDPDSVRAGGHGAGVRLLGIEVATDISAREREALEAFLHPGEGDVATAARTLLDWAERVVLGCTPAKFLEMKTLGELDGWMRSGKTPGSSYFARALERAAVHRAQLAVRGLEIHQVVEALDELADLGVTAQQIVGRGVRFGAIHATKSSHASPFFRRTPAPGSREATRRRTR